jgi:hypothetical protein
VVICCAVRTALCKAKRGSFKASEKDGGFGMGLQHITTTFFGWDLEMGFWIVGFTDLLIILNW